MEIIDQREGAVYAPPENWSWLPAVTGWVWIIDLDAEPGEEKWGLGMLDDNHNIRLI